MLDAISQSQVDSQGYVNIDIIIAANRVYNSVMDDCLKSLSAADLIDVQPYSSGVCVRIEEKGILALSITSDLST